jgi:hypothetical protein
MCTTSFNVKNPSIFVFRVNSENKRRSAARALLQSCTVYCAVRTEFLDNITKASCFWSDNPSCYCILSTNSSRFNFIRINPFSLEQWYSTWGKRTPGGMRRHLRGYVKLKKYILFHDKHWIIRARFRVSHKWPDVRTCDLGAQFLSLSLSLSLLYPILIWAASFILFHTVHIILLC